MRLVDKLRAPARELAGRSPGLRHRRLPAQAYVRRQVAKAVMKQADSIRREDAIFDDSPTESTPTRSRRRATGGGPSDHLDRFRSRLTERRAGPCATPPFTGGGAPRRRSPVPPVQRAHTGGLGGRPLTSVSGTLLASCLGRRRVEVRKLG